MTPKTTKTFVFGAALLAAAAAFSSLPAATPAGAQEKKTVRIGTEGAYPPFNFFDANQNLMGFDIDIANALCEKMEVNCVFVAQDWDGIIPALLAGKYDAIIASMSITPERQKVVDFTNKYYQTPARFVAPKDSPLTGNTPADLAGKTIGAQSATTHATYLEDKYTDSEIRLYPTQDEANLDLINGRLDAILADSIVLYEWLNNTEDGQCCQFVGDPVVDVQYFGEGAGIAVRKEDQELKEAFNEAIAAILADGTYEKINAKYFPFSIY